MRLITAACLLALPTGAGAAEWKHQLHLRGGPAAYMIAKQDLVGLHGAVAYRSELGPFAVTFEPLSLMVDAFGDVRGMRLGMLHPGFQVGMFPQRSVSPYVGASLGGALVTSNDRPNESPFAVFSLEPQLTVGVDLARRGDVNPSVQLDVLPTAGIYPFIEQRPVAVVLSVSAGLHTEISVLEAFIGWL